MPPLNFSTSKPLNQIIFLILIGLIINLFLYHHNGPILTFDSYQFIAYAEEIANGNFYNDRYFWYFSYAGTLAFVNFIGLEYEYIIYFQIILYLVSLAVLYKLIYYLTSYQWIAIILCIGYILFFEITQRNIYVLTESIFTALVIGVLFKINQPSSESDIKRKLILLIPLLLFSGFIRPNGILLIASIAFSLILFIERPITKWTLLVGFIVAGFFLLDQLIISLDILSEYQLGVMVYNADQVDPEVYSVSGLLMDTAGLKSISGEGTMGLLEFIFKNPAYFIEGFFKKVFYLLFHIRPYYSLGHNLFILAFLLPIYGLSIYGWMKSKRSILSVCSLLFVLLNITTVGVTWCVWEGRFLFPLLPIFFLYAGVGLKSLNVILRLRSV